MKRYLLITQRRIPLDRADEYARLWVAVRTCAEAAGARAWMFTSERAGDRFIEFIEWQSEPLQTVPARPEVMAARAELDAAFRSEESDTWIEAKI